ncbi:izumo sperm-egg fusion protein 1 isoform X2 [Alosa alosa]|uniref:izumo sperm-egg fusion protein 1 isoform X2 n=1 Tax=Alosa alosa TaxID=278164 RepID=UPI002015275E|nr:izumo sperm-egg fusion protein 1 isoform X2 [Alosa alosa]
MFKFSPPILLLLLYSSPVVQTCLQCDRVVVYIHEDFLVSQKDLTIQEQKDLQNIIDHGYVTFQEASKQYHGVIDPTTLYRARTEYHSEFDRYWQDKRGGLCPNKCGLLYQIVMNCDSCKYEQRTCPSATPPKDCGDHHLEAEEGDEVVLDCFLSWHSLVTGHKDYHYSWRPGLQNVTPGDEFQVLVVTPDSNIILNQLVVAEQGVYLCLLQDNNGTVYSRTSFTLTVSTLPLTTPRPIMTLPSVPKRRDGVMLYPDTLLIILGLLSALSLAASLTLLIALRPFAVSSNTSHLSLRRAFTSLIPPQIRTQSCTDPLLQSGLLHACVMTASLQSTEHVALKGDTCTYSRSPDGGGEGSHHWANQWTMPHDAEATESPEGGVEGRKRRRKRKRGVR